MATLHDKIETALNEARILILGGQVLVGVQFRTFFEGDFQQVPMVYQRILFIGLGVLLLGIACLMAPASYHSIVAKHRDRPDLLRFTSSMLAVGLLPFAVSLATTMMVSLEKLSTPPMAIAAASLSLVGCVALWYGFPLFVRRRIHVESSRAENEMETQSSSQNLSVEVKEVLLEARMVLPGAQALLGFQFINIWLEGFDSLPQNVKLAHLASLCAVAVSTALLMLPASYHRIAERGEDTQQFVGFAGRMLLTAMVFLALGVCGDFFVIGVKMKFSLATSICLSGGMLAFFLGLWFGYTEWKKTRA